MNNATKFGALIAATLGFGHVANAAGFIDQISMDPTYYAGWACNPATPNVPGWVHFYRSDNKFVGFLRAESQREAAVGGICGDAGAHGFAGNVQQNWSLYDSLTYQIRAYFIPDDGRVEMELQNRINVVFTPPPVPTVENCGGGAPGVGWVQIKDKGFCTLNSWSNSTYRTWVYLPAYGVGATIDVCSLPSVPSSWLHVSTQISTECTGISQHAFTIRKMTN